ncbi:MAG: hypothetical protein WB615_11730 [Candidatus Tumulicola sp.]
MKRSLEWPSVLCAATVLFAGCAGGGAQNSMMPGGATGPASNLLGGASGGATLFRVHVPWTIGNGTSPGNGSTPSAAPLPVFPGTTPTPFATPTPLAPPGPSGAAPSGQMQALTLNLIGPTTVTQTIALTAGSSGCANVASGAVCQTALPLVPGNYTAVVSAYGSANASANAFGATQTIAFSVAYGTANVVNLVVAGIPSQIAIVPGSSMSYQNAQGGIDLYGAGKHVLVAQLVDSNQSIVVGSASPTVTAGDVGGALALSIAQSSPAVPNVFSVSPPAAYGGGSATLRVTAAFPGQPSNPCLQLTAACAGSVNVDVKQVLAVANSSANSVTLYAGGQNVPVATITNGVANPQSLVFDGAGDLFVASQPGSVTEYAAPYTGLPATIAIGVNHPQALALDNRGNLFVANGNGSNTVTEYSPPYGGAPNVTISTGIDDPVSLSLDFSGDLFVANQASNTVTEYSPPYSGTPTTLSNGLYGPNSLTIDGRGNLFVSNLNSTPNSVVQFTPPFSSSNVPSVTISNGVNEQGAIAISSSANLFVPNQGSNTVTEYQPPYGGAPTTIAGGQNQPVALAIDASGNLYVANYGNNTVTQYPPPYAGASWVTLSNGVSSPQALALSPPTSALGMIP